MRCRLVILAVFASIGLAGFVCQHLKSSAAKPDPEVMAQTRRSPARRAEGGDRRRRRYPISAAARIDYSNFSHRTPAHQQACDNCHKFPSPSWNIVRKGDSAFPDVTDYPQHASCVGCHNQQFFTGARPVICSVCHIDVSPRNGTRNPFPSLGEAFYDTRKGLNFASDFEISFPHNTHIELVGHLQRETEMSRGVTHMVATLRRAQDDVAEANKSCNVCHKTYQPQGDADEEYVTKPPKDLPEGAFWLKKGTFKTYPITHASCFACHSQESGLTPAPTDCNTCHKLAPPASESNERHDFDPNLAKQMGITDPLTLMMWRQREAGRFRHEWFSHTELSCASCHNVTTMNTLDERTEKVPILSCGGAGTGCHITATAEDGGILNEVIAKKKVDPAFRCTKCHIVLGKEAIPKSHLDALDAIKRKVSSLK